MSGRRILVVDDDPVVVEVVRGALAREGYEVHVAQDGAEALERLAEVAPDLVILDIQMPEMDGLSACRELRKRHNTPVLMLSGRTESVDKIVGLEMGADDYLAKPFDPRELVARVRAMLRRWSTWGSAEQREVIQLGPLTIDVGAHRVELLGKHVHLTPIEFSLLRVMASHPGLVMTRQTLLDRVWGHDFYGDERTVDVHVRHVRKKLKQVNGSADYVVAVRGVGYKFEL